MTTQTSSDERPLGYWLTATDRLLAAEFARAFDTEGITRRDWRMLNAIDGTAPIGRPLDERKLGRLIGLGWVAQGETGWALTDDGRSAKKRLGTIVDGIRATIADAVSAEDYATTIASLAQIARALGWDESAPLPRKRRGHGGHRGRGAHRHGHGGFGHHGQHGFGPHGFRAQDEHEHTGHGCHGRTEGPHHHARFGEAHGGGHRRVHRMAQHAYERGFDAGFDRGSATR